MTKKQKVIKTVEIEVVSDVVTRLEDFTIQTFLKAYEEVRNRWGQYGLIEVMIKEEGYLLFELKACGSAESGIAEIVRITFQLDNQSGVVLKRERITAIHGEGIESPEIFVVYDSLKFLSEDLSTN